MTNNKPPIDGEKPRYHHGDLKKQLLDTTVQMIQDGGVESLSLRKLAERVNVSRTAAYHHFKGKNELLASVAEQGFEQLNLLLVDILKEEAGSLHERAERAVMGYVQFALDNRAQYSLMFGDQLWKKQPSEKLQRQAKACFRQYVNLFKRFKEEGLLSDSQDPLRLSQIVWSTLHGLVTLSHDGIFVRSTDLEDICQYALNQLKGLVRVD